jgi:hypothetical protein
MRISLVFGLVLASTIACASSTEPVIDFPAELHSCIITSAAGNPTGVLGQPAVVASTPDSLLAIVGVAGTLDGMGRFTQVTDWWVYTCPVRSGPIESQADCGPNNEPETIRFALDTTVWAYQIRGDSIQLTYPSPDPSGRTGQTVFWNTSLLINPMANLSYERIVSEWGGQVASAGIELVGPTFCQELAGSRSRVGHGPSD